MVRLSLNVWKEEIDTELPMVEDSRESWTGHVHLGEKNLLSTNHPDVSHDEPTNFLAKCLRIDHLVYVSFFELYSSMTLVIIVNNSKSLIYPIIII